MCRANVAVPCPKQAGYYRTRKSQCTNAKAVKQENSPTQGKVILLFYLGLQSIE